MACLPITNVARSIDQHQEHTIRCKAWLVIVFVIFYLNQLTKLLNLVYFPGFD